MDYVTKPFNPVELLARVRTHVELKRKSDNEKDLICRLKASLVERNRAEETLRKSEEKYRAILENASDAIWLADEKGNLLEANKKAEELLGYAREELLRMNYTQIHPLTEQEKTVEEFKKVIEQGSGSIHDGLLCCKDGKVIPVDITGSVIEYGGRKVVQGSFRDISEQKQAKDGLERLVGERTVELSEKNKQLTMEIKERRLAEAALRKKAKELQLKSGKLEELNTALKVLLQQRGEDKTELEEKVISNVKHLLIPHIETLKKRKMDQGNRVVLEILESNLKSITSAFSHKLSSKYLSLTPTEIKIANLVREGKSTKEMAEMMAVSHYAIELHRFNMRKKFGLKSRKINLQSYLLSIS